MPSSTIFPLTAVRALALHAQGLITPLGREPSPTPNAVYDVVERLGCVQIDTLQRVRRSHYLAVWSRLGNYEPDNLDRLVYGDGSKPHDRQGRRLFEYWFHGACFIPLSEFRYRIPMMRRLKEDGGWNRGWLAKEKSKELVEAVLERVRREGPLRASDFKHEGPPRGGWWDWKPAKRALEVLYNQGDLMISDRINFQRLYDLHEHVLPGWVDKSAPSWDETARYLVERSVKALGICGPSQAADYVYDLRRTTARPFIDALITEGVLALLQTRLITGEEHTLLVHRDHLPLLEQASDGALVAKRTTFLSPFDSLFYPKGRDIQIWNFQQILEAYKPAKARKWGYFCLPILHGDQLVGRFDPRLDRGSGTMHLDSLHLEPGIDPGEELVEAVAVAMRDFMAFHEAQDLEIGFSQPKDLAKKILTVL